MIEKSSKRSLCRAKKTKYICFNTKMRLNEPKLQLTVKRF